VGPNEGECLDLKVRGLYLDGRTRESTLGASHEITERLFVVRRAFRVNDTLPGDKATAPGWMWQRGGWLLGKKLFAIVFQVGCRKPILKKPLGMPAAMMRPIRSARRQFGSGVLCGSLSSQRKIRRLLTWCEGMPRIW
jgi:hypothetical protein